MNHETQFELSPMKLNHKTNQMKVRAKQGVEIIHKTEQKNLVRKNRATILENTQSIKVKL